MTIGGINGSGIDTLGTVFLLVTLRVELLAVVARVLAIVLAKLVADARATLAAPVTRTGLSPWQYIATLIQLRRLVTRRLIGATVTGVALPSFLTLTSTITFTLAMLFTHAWQSIAPFRTGIGIALAIITINRSSGAKLRAHALATAALAPT